MESFFRDVLPFPCPFIFSDLIFMAFKEVMLLFFTRCLQGHHTPFPLCSSSRQVSDKAKGTSWASVNVSLRNAGTFWIP